MKLPTTIDPLLRTLDALEVIGRHLRPGVLAGLMRTSDQDFRRLDAVVAAPATEAAAPAGEAAADTQGESAESQVEALVASARDSAAEAVARLRGAVGQPDELRRAYRALRGLSVSLERLYPLAGLFEPVNRFFLDAPMRDDPDWALENPPHLPPERTGVMQFGEAERGGFWLYVPEAAADAPMPLVMALHGGAGSGRQFLWRWLRTARSRRLILVAPTALGDTWSIMGDDVDSPNLGHVLDFVRGHWPVAPDRLLLTGMSDGGTFCYTSGLEPASPFTHLAPVCANFVPMLAAMAEPARVRGLPIHVVHGTLDWMFPAEVGRAAVAALGAAGARVTHTELADLSHVYPSEINARLVDWMSAIEAVARSG